MALIPHKWRRVSLALLVVGGWLVYRVLAPTFPQDRTVLLAFEPGGLKDVANVSVNWTGEEFQAGEPSAGATVYLQRVPANNVVRSHVRLPNGPFWAQITMEQRSGRRRSVRRRIVLDGETVTIHVPPAASTLPH